MRKQLPEQLSKVNEVKVGMHQGSALSPLLFVIVMEAISSEFRVALPWELLYADDLAVIEVKYSWLLQVFSFLFLKFA